MKTEIAMVPIPHIKEVIKGVTWRQVGSSILNIRYCKDYDIICYEKDILIETKGDEWLRTGEYKGKRYEFLLADNQPSLQKILSLDFTENQLKSEQVCYILKAGHIHVGGRRQEEWEKHIHDYHFLRRNSWNIGGPIIDNLIKMVRKDTNDRVKQRTPKLTGVKKDEFFDDSVKKYVDHDYIHEVVAYEMGIPRYTKMQKNDSTVTCNKDMWEVMPYFEKCQTVAEECSVIAIERHILPQIMESLPGKPLFLAYKWALYRVCTNLCSGWFRQFAIDNYYTILNMYDEQKLNENIEAVLKTIKYGSYTERAVHVL